MNATTLKALVLLKGLNQSDLARAAGITRQRVSQWFTQRCDQDFIDARTSTVRQVASALGIGLNELMQPMPLFDNPDECEKLASLLLWDKLYPDLFTLFIAAVKREPAAIARMVHSFGLFACAKILGPNVWHQFPHYKRFLTPARRTGLEKLWMLHQSHRKT